MGSKWSRAGSRTRACCLQRKLESEWTSTVRGTRERQVTSAERRHDDYKRRRRGRRAKSTFSVHVTPPRRLPLGPLSCAASGALCRRRKLKWNPTTCSFSFSTALTPSTQTAARCERAQRAARRSSSRLVLELAFASQGPRRSLARGKASTKFNKGRTRPFKLSFPLRRALDQPSFQALGGLGFLVSSTLRILAPS